MAGTNGSTDGAARIKGAILFRKREWPLWNPKRKACIGSLKLEEVRRLRIESALRGGIASLAAIGGAIRFGLLLLPAAALPILRRCSLIFFCRWCRHFRWCLPQRAQFYHLLPDSANKRGERSNAATVGTCKIDRIQSRRRLRKTADTQAERQRVIEVRQIV